MCLFSYLFFSLYCVVVTCDGDLFYQHNITHTNVPQTCDGCGNCGAHFWCVEAEEAYCKDCKSIYSSLKYTKDHHIYNFGELIKDRSLQVII